MLVASVTSHAQCSRAINVPVSPTGLSVTVGADGVGGVYPDILRSVAAKEGCSFTFSVVPRARQEVMFETGKADLLIPASRTPRRDEHGIFVPLIYNRATLISLASERPAVRSAQELLERRELRVALVRGYDYGEAYQELVKELGKQGRLAFDVDANSIARKLAAGMADVTIMAPSILVGAMFGDTRVEHLTDKLRYEPLPELPWGDSGAYISKTAVSAEDRALLRDLLENATKSGALWKAFLRYYPPGSLKDSVRPR
ncbi:MAG: transporter substrate-binding domain-containing protein [Burkholderiaceae bacterium]|nr:transporter substrate-binding domain-containing protein [Burkholderiaceae bacterium]